jgi:hypothetical protein
MAKKSANSASFDTDSIARRLKIIRCHVTGDNQSAFARRLGITQPRWNNFEHGYPINLRVCAMLLAEVEGLSIDWIVKGVPYNMPQGLQDQLSALEDKLFSRPGKSSGSGSRKR